MVEAGWGGCVSELEYSEAIYHSERISCEKIKKNIGEILSISKDFYPYYEHPDTKEVIYIKDMYQNIPYSLALADLLEITYNQYEKLKGD